MSEKRPVNDWATDYDIFDPELRKRPGADLERSQKALSHCPYGTLGRVLAPHALRGSSGVCQDGP